MGMFYLLKGLPPIFYFRYLFLKLGISSILVVVVASPRILERSEQLGFETCVRRNRPLEIPKGLTEWIPKRPLSKHCT